MGGKSRKSGGVSKKLIQRIKAGAYGKPANYYNSKKVYEDEEEIQQRLSELDSEDEHPS